jgi:putative Ca2+/H+ antiporter (TMEM165/GDT1 family)
MAGVILLCLYCLASVAENYLSKQGHPQNERPEELLKDTPFWPSFFLSLLSTIWIEVWDKTFIVAGVYTASKNRKAVWWAYITVMCFITLVNCVIGCTFMTLLFTNREAELAYITFAYLSFEELWYLNRKKTGTDDLLQPLNPNNKVIKTLNRWVDAEVYLKACVLLFLVECTDSTIISTNNLAETRTFIGVFLGCMLAFVLTGATTILAGWWLGTQFQKRYVLLFTALVFTCFAVFEIVY